MITVAQAKEAVDDIRVYSDATASHSCQAALYLLEEFIKQYEDWVKVKKVSALLKGKDE